MNTGTPSSAESHVTNHAVSPLQTADDYRQSGLSHLTMRVVYVAHPSEHRAKSSGALAHPSNLREAAPAVRPRRSDASVRAELSAKPAAGRIGQRGEVEFWMVLVLAAFALFVLAYVVNESADRERCEARGGYWYHAYQSAGVCLAKGMVLP